MSVRRPTVLAWLLPALLLAWLASAIRPVAARAEEAWETAVREAEQEEDRELDEARRTGSTTRIVRQYESRVSRQPSALNHYLLGRALYYDGDRAGAERQLRRALELQRDFWFANLRLAMLDLERKDLASAERHVTEVLQRRPRELGALKLYAQLLLEKKDWDRAIRVHEDLLAQEPTNLGVRRNLAFALMEKGDWPRAVKELRVLRGRLPNEPAVRWYYATALYQTGELKEAARELEGLVRLEPENVRALDLLKVIYVTLQDAKSLHATLERMLPLVQDEAIAARIKELLKQLEEGEGPGAPPPEAGAAWDEDSWMALIDRCTDATSVETRRRALQTYYGANFPQMPHVLVSRVHPDYEPDAICRRWLLRIMGQMKNPQLAQVTAFALRDPDIAVRAAAAETLGEIETPSGLLYLMYVLLGAPLDTEPTEGQVTLLNAARRAAIQITGRLDERGGADVWVPAESLGDVRRDWMTWLASPDGVHARLRAIADLEAQEDLRPELHLLDDVSDPDLSISRAAYGVLLRRSRLPSDDAVAAAMWPRFPFFAAGDLTEENMGKVRAAVRAWWDEWVALRKKTLDEAVQQPPGAPKDD